MEKWPLLDAPFLRAGASSWSAMPRNASQSLFQSQSGSGWTAQSGDLFSSQNFLWETFLGVLEAFRQCPAVRIHWLLNNDPVHWCAFLTCKEAIQGNCWIKPFSPPSIRLSKFSFWSGEGKTPTWAAERIFPAGNRWLASTFSQL